MQALTAVEYPEGLGIEVPVLGGFNPEPIGRYNVTPLTRVLLIHWEEEGLRQEPKSPPCVSQWK